MRLELLTDSPAPPGSLRDPRLNVGDIALCGITRPGCPRQEEITEDAKVT